MEPQVAFYRLSRKVVNDQNDIPAEARQVMYYSLAIGHHVGVLDCFSELMAVPVSEYQRWLNRLPAGEARLKLAGALKWGEIEINRTHADELLPLFRGLLPVASGPDAHWIETMIECLLEMKAEPALYLMLRVRG